MKPFDLPAEIVKAIDDLQRWSILLGGLTAGAVFKVQEIRAVLTATILARLAAAESARDEAVAERDEAITIQSPEDVLEPQWGHNAFRSVLGESYKPKVWSKDRALNHASLREALAIEGLPDRAHDVIAALIWNRVVVGNNAHHAWEQRDAALARAERLEEALQEAAEWHDSKADNLRGRPQSIDTRWRTTKHVEEAERIRAALTQPAPAEKK